MQHSDGFEAEMLAETRAEVGVADHKASLVLAGVGIGFGALLGGLLAGDWSPERLDGAARVAWWLGAGAVIGAVGSAGSAVWPRFKTSDANEGIFYWGHCVKYKSFDAWTARLDEQDSSKRDRSRYQLWSLSHIVYKKYVSVQWSLGLAGVASLLFIFAAVLH